MKRIITEEMINHQKYKFYLAPLLFLSFLAVFPYCFENLIFLQSLILVIFPGSYLYNWICFLVHETWHKYVKTIPNAFLFNFYSWLLAADPQVYKLSHGAHHAHVHTWSDIEIYPLGEIKHQYYRRLFNVLRFFLGQVFVYNVALFVLRGHPKFCWRQSLLALFMICVIYGSLFYFSHVLCHVSPLNVGLSWILFTFVGGLTQHTSQLIQHWGVIAEDKSLAERNILTRNLKPSGMIERMLLFLTHDDAYAHVLHHTYPRIYTRPFFRKLAMPENAVRINFREYLKIAWSIIKN